MRVETIFTELHLVGSIALRRLQIHYMALHCKGWVVTRRICNVLPSPNALSLSLVCGSSSVSSLSSSSWASSSLGRIQTNRPPFSNQISKDQSHHQRWSIWETCASDQREREAYLEIKRGGATHQSPETERQSWWTWKKTTVVQLRSNSSACLLLILWTLLCTNRLEIQNQEYVEFMADVVSKNTFSTLYFHSSYPKCILWLCWTFVHLRGNKKAWESPRTGRDTGQPAWLHTQHLASLPACLLPRAGFF